MSRGQKRVIDYHDLRIPLTELIAPSVEVWLEDFTEHHEFVELDPRIKNEILLINSTDFIALLGYVDKTALSELDLQRFLSAGRKALEQQLTKAMSLDTQSHYKWCLGALKSLPLGRYLEDFEESST